MGKLYADFGSAEHAMKVAFNASHVSLHVRKTNRAALALYKDTLGFEVVNIEKKYCKCSRPPPPPSPEHVTSPFMDPIVSFL